MAALRVYNGSSWVPVVGSVYDGSDWVGLMQFYDGADWIDLAGADTYTITIGVSGDFLLAGYTSSFGSSDPASPTVNGNTLNSVIGDLGTPRFVVQIAGSFLAQDFFERIDGFDGAGSPFGYATSAADDYISNASATTWRWDGTADWQFTDEDEEHDVTFT